MFGEIFSQNSSFSRFMNFLWNVIVISILWFVCSIPVITIGQLPQRPTMQWQRSSGTIPAQRVLSFSPHSAGILRRRPSLLLVIFW